MLGDDLLQPLADVGHGLHPAHPLPPSSFTFTDVPLRVRHTVGGGEVLRRDDALDADVALEQWIVCGA